MTQDQIMGILRQVLQIVGTLATAVGWLSPEAVAHWTAVILSVGGPLAMLAGVIWNIVANKKTSIAASVGAMPETSVQPGPGGSATVTISDPTIAAAALQGNKA